MDIAVQRCSDEVKQRQDLLYNARSVFWRKHHMILAIPLCMSPPPPGIFILPKDNFIVTAVYSPRLPIYRQSLLPALSVRLSFQACRCISYL